MMHSPHFHPGSPWHSFHPESPGFLERKLDRDEPVSRNELIAVYRANEGMAWEGPLFEMLNSVLSGTFKEKSGPKAGAYPPIWSCIRAWVQLEVEDIRAERAAPGYTRRRGDPSLMEEAYENTARAFRLSSGKRLANELSSRNLC